MDSRLEISINSFVSKTAQASRIMEWIYGKNAAGTIPMFSTNLMMMSKDVYQSKSYQSHKPTLNSFGIYY